VKKSGSFARDQRNHCGPKGQRSQEGRYAQAPSHRRDKKRVREWDNPGGKRCAGRGGGLGRRCEEIARGVSCGSERKRKSVCLRKGPFGFYFVFLAFQEGLLGKKGIFWTETSTRGFRGGGLSLPKERPVRVQEILGKRPPGDFPKTMAGVGWLERSSPGNGGEKLPASRQGGLSCINGLAPQGGAKGEGGSCRPNGGVFRKRAFCRSGDVAISRVEREGREPEGEMGQKRGTSDGRKGWLRGGEKRGLWGVCGQRGCMPLWR